MLGGRLMTTGLSKQQVNTDFGKLLDIMCSVASEFVEGLSLDACKNQCTGSMPHNALNLALRGVLCRVLV